MLNYKFPMLFAVPFLAFISCEKSDLSTIESGVSKVLADKRQKQISDIKYHLDFSIPNQLEEPISDENKITFNLQNITSDLYLDFKNSVATVQSVNIEETITKPRVINEHIVIAKE